MKALRDIEKKIKQKEEEIQDLKVRAMQAQAYVDGLKESLRTFTKNTSITSESETSTIRPGSMVGKAMIALQGAGKALHVVDLLKAMGEETSKDKRVSLSGSLGFYVRKKQVFTRPAPNVFGLVEFETKNEEEEEDLPF